MNKAKEVLERLESLGRGKLMSGMGMLSELQELIDMARNAVDEIYEAEQELEKRGVAL